MKNPNFKNSPCEIHLIANADKLEVNITGDQIGLTFLLALMIRTDRTMVFKMMEASALAGDPQLEPVWKELRSKASQWISVVTPPTSNN
jgi:hypothetical protein